jgi:hypothetical protein
VVALATVSFKLHENFQTLIHFIPVSSTMKFTFICLLVVLSFTAFVHCEDSSMTAAIHQIIRDFYVLRSERFDFFTCGNLSEGSKEIVKSLMKQIEVPVRVIHSDDGFRLSKIKQSAVFFFNSSAHFNSFLKMSFITLEYPRDLNVLVYIDNFSDRDRIEHDDKNARRRIFAKPSHKFRYAFLARHRNKIDIQLKTLVKYQQSDCEKTDFKVINEFSNRTKMWKTREFSAKSQENFNGCPLKISIEKSRNPERSITRYLHAFNQIFSQKLNYTIEKVIRFGEEDLKLAIGCSADLIVDDPRHVSTFSFTTNNDIILYSECSLSGDEKNDKSDKVFQTDVWVWIAGSLLAFPFILCALRFVEGKTRWRDRNRAFGKFLE